MNRVILLFVDGVGIGNIDYNANPFFKYGFKTFEKLFNAIPSTENNVLENGGYFIFPTDAILGVAGLPQSGTGQTSIFCGVNAPKIIGQHFGPYPYSTLVPIIKEQNIFKYFIEKNNSVSFVNAYPKLFFDYVGSGKRRLSVTTLSCTLNKMRLNRVTDLKKGNAISAEITNEIWKSKLNYNLRVIKPETAARRLLRISEKHQFTVYEFFLTDHLGHGRNTELLESTIRELDQFLYTIFTEFNKKDTTIILCSDHGNFEDISIKSHTLNPALTMSAGRNSRVVFESVKDISQIKQKIIELTE
ncbi:MAG: alkaline phosphatase family protein [Ignavibacteriaceae bacterium]|nr:alkaline phosphatase family protein [Ignavibacteriaceae bacterium]